MPSVERSFRRQVAVFWEASGRDGYNQVKTLAPVELRVRWVNKRRQVTGADGTPITIDASAVTDRELPIGSALWLGTLDDWYGSGSAGSDVGVMEVVHHDTTPDIKARANMHEAGLQFSRSARPTLA
jgi:hypothetical protein